MAQLRQSEKQLKDQNANVVVVTFDGSKRARNYAKAFDLPWPLLLDDGYQLYQAYGLPKASIWTLIRPDILFRYTVDILKGHFPGIPGADKNQLGGDVLIDPDGIVRLNHVSETPHDRPSVEMILSLITENETESKQSF